METRICRYCFKLKPLIEFQRSKTSLGGHSHKCKPCHAKAERERNRKYGYPVRGKKKIEPVGKF